MKKQKRFKRVVKYEPFNGLNEDWALVISAIPIIGTFFILLYFLVRSKEEYYEEIK